MTRPFTQQTYPISQLLTSERVYSKPKSGQVIRASRVIQTLHHVNLEMEVLIADTGSIIFVLASRLSDEFWSTGHITTA
jgi:hypothetical protein